MQPSNKQMKQTNPKQTKTKAQNKQTNRQTQHKTIHPTNLICRKIIILQIKLGLIYLKIPLKILLKPK